MTTSTKQNKIEDEYNNRIEEIKENIERISYKQDELHSYIMELDHLVKLSEQDLQLSKNKGESFRIRSAIQHYLETISELYSSIASFENIRQRYSVDITKLTESKIRTLNFDLVRLEEEVNKQNVDVIKVISDFKNSLQEINKGNNKKYTTEMEKELNSNPIYSLE